MAYGRNDLGRLDGKAITRMSLWRLGFRPFFLFGSGYAVIAILVWLSFLTGYSPHLALADPVVWHSHEMVFGFVAAVIAGFVLTAIQNWTGIQGIRGNRLRLVFFLWLAARVLMFIPGAPLLLVAVVDLSFFPCVAFLLTPYFRSPEIGMERFFYLFFFLFFLGNTFVHLEALRLDPFHFRDGTARIGIRLGLDTAILVTFFMGGRVIPFFTESSLARTQPRTYPWIERLSPVVTVAFLIGDLCFRETAGLAAIAFAVALIHGVRLFGWQVRRLRRIPLIWVLHLAYLWMVLGFALSGLAALGTLPVSLATHAFTVGGLGIMIYGMISRVSLGHTGRRLHPTAWTVGGYVLLAIAATIRVFGPLLPGVELRWIWFGTGIPWAAAFLIFFVQYTPLLTQPRVDGRPG